MTSNIGQNYPYTSETADQRAAVIEELIKSRTDLGPKLVAETTPVEADEERFWIW